MWRQERQSKFNDEFEGWRKGRASVGGRQAGSSSGGAEAKADGGYLPAGHNESMKRLQSAAGVPRQPVATTSGQPKTTLRRVMIQIGSERRPERLNR
jgi:hypothetical protein